MNQLYVLADKKASPAAEYEGSSNAFSMDHLMVDSDGDPAPVEVKRSGDNRIRREVMALGTRTS